MFKFVIGFFIGMIFACLVAYTAFFLGGIKYEKEMEYYGTNAEEPTRVE